MNIKQIAKIVPGQDGTIFSNYFFRFDEAKCYVYSLKDFNKVSEFVLDRAQEINPHSNAVCFGKEYFDPDDEFPLLYSNMYNNFAGRPDQMVGVCCVYRLTREGNNFTTKLVQLISIGFTDTELWRSENGINDVRPYGNFVVDAEKGKYYAFVMRDSPESGRYFCFDLPRLSDGEYSEKYKVKNVILNKENIKFWFDGGYPRFLQGATFHNGKIWSVEGFSNSKENPPALRVIDPEARKEELFVDLTLHGITIEPEMIDFFNGECYYSDADRMVYIIEI